MLLLSLVSLLSCQGKLPAEVVRAEKVIAEKPDDQTSHFTVGKYYAILGDWEKAVPHLSKGSSEFFRVIADLDMAGADPYVIGEAWWNGAVDVEVNFLTGAASSSKVELKKTAAALRPLMRERAAFWFSKAWPSAAEPQRTKMLGYGRAASSPLAGPARVAGAPSDWTIRNGVSRDGTYARSGRSSLLVASSSKEVANYARFQGEMILIPSGVKEVALSAWVRAEGIEPRCSIQVGFWTSSMDGITQGGAEISDGPFWIKIERAVQVPERASKMSVFLVAESSQGKLWADDVSLVAGGKEMLKNGSFEK